MASAAANFETLRKMCLAALGRRDLVTDPMLYVRG